MSDKFKLGIVGKGFVGSAVSNGFDKNVEQIIVDPVHTETTLEQLVEQSPTLTFICVPTPPNEDGSINVDIVTDVLVELSMRDYKGVVVVKSTIIPDYLHRFKKSLT
jgi:UDP-glucose 6-dehydrogenase